MTVHEYADAHAFLENARSFLFKEELANNVLLASVLTLAKSTRQPSLIFLAAGLPIQGCALRSPNHRWIVAANDTPSAKALAAEIERREALAQSRLVLISREYAKTFNFAERASQNLMVLKKLAPFNKPAPGILRLAHKKDAKLLIGWSKKFAQELDLDESPQEAEDAIKRSIELKQLYVWDDGGKVTAMAATGGFTPRGARISMVYTDPNQRSKHYATTLVHRVSHKLLQDDRTPLLLADSKNEQTKHIYESLGFKTVKELCELKPALGSKSRDSGRKPVNASR